MIICQLVRSLLGFVCAYNEVSEQLVVFLLLKILVIEASCFHCFFVVKILAVRYLILTHNMEVGGYGEGRREVPHGDLPRFLVSSLWHVRGSILPDVMREEGAVCLSTPR